MNVNKNNLLKLVTEIDIYNFYLPPGKNNRFYVPWRVDKNPSLVIFENSYTNNLWWRDLAYGISGDVFNLVGNIYNLDDFYAILVKINLDMGLNLDFEETRLLNISDKTTPVSKSQELKRLQIKRSNNNIGFRIMRKENTPVYPKEVLRYYRKIGYDKKALSKEGIFVADKVFLNKSIIWRYHSKNPIIVYLYKYKGKVYFELYRPWEPVKERKWLSNMDEVFRYHVWDGEHALNYTLPNLFLVEGKKDRMVLSSLGFNSLGIFSTSTKPNPDKITALKKSFNLFSIFDNDPAGERISEKFQKYDVEPLLLNYGNKGDIFDNFLNIKNEFKTTKRNLKIDKPHETSRQVTI